MKELIERLEKLTEPDRRVDAMLWMLEPCEPPDCAPDVKQRIYARFMVGQQWGDSEVPHYTSSVDAALKLVPPDHYWTVSGGIDHIGAPRGMDGMFSAACPDQPDSFATRFWAKHPAIALCVAALKARSEDMGRETA